MTSTSASSKNTFHLILAAVSACLLFGVIAGFYTDISVITGILNSANNGLTYAEIETAYSVYKIVSALFAPIVAVVILKKSNIFVLLFGWITLLAGIAVLAIASSIPMLIFGLGILVAVGCAFLSFGAIFGIVSPLFGEKAAMILSTVFTISSLSFSVVFTPVLQTAFDNLGYIIMMWIMFAIVACTLPLIFILGSKKYEDAVREDKNSLNLIDTAKTLFRQKEVYILLLFVFACEFVQGLQYHLYTGLTVLEIPAFGITLTYSMTKIISAIAAFILTFVIIKVKRTYTMTALIILLAGITECIMAFLPIKSLEIVLFVVLATVVFAAFYPLQTLIARRRYAPVLVGSLLCITGFVGNLAAALNTFLGGICLDYFGNFTLLIILEGLAGLITGGIIIYFAIKIGEMKKNTT